MVALVLPLGLAACGTATVPGDPGEAKEARVAASPEASFVATDYSFTGPDVLPAGWVTIHLKNEGTELHHVQLIKLGEGKTVDDFSAFVTSGSTTEPGWMQQAAGPNAAIGPVETSATVKLEPGNYVVTCLIPSSDGTPHAAKGMVKELTVEGETAAPAPDADMSVSLTDFAFKTADEWTAGKHVIEVTNVGSQPHELVIAKLDDGKTAMDLLNAFSPGAPAGPPPGTPVGGITGMAPGQVAYVPVDLTPGRYAVLCFITDPASGKMHGALGMMDEFSIQ